LDDAGAAVIAEIVLNGAQSEVQKRGKLDNGAEYIVLKVYFMNDET
jgi:hypothetical protein